MFNRDVDDVPSHASEWEGVIKPIAVIKRMVRYRVWYNEFTHFADQPWPHNLRLDWWSSSDLSLKKGRVGMRNLFELNVS